ncbi:MAG: RpiB/LacA/LacB family sugar-phosphate isomerase [Bacteroidota bacterium]
MKKLSVEGNREMMRIGIATDFSWFELKRKLIESLNAVDYELVDIGAYELVAGENYPDFVVPLAKAVSDENDKQNRTHWLNGVEACAEVNKIPGVCATVISEPTATSVEAGDEDLYVRCIGGQIKGYALSGKKVLTFLNADNSAGIPSNQQLAKVRMLRTNKKMAEQEKYLA